MVPRTKMLRRQQRRIFSLRRIAHHLRGHRFEGLGGSTRAMQIPNDIVQFGVYTGGGLKAWVDAMPLLGFNFTGRLFGFDSFSGMPHEEGSLLLRHHKQDPAWARGGLNAAAIIGSGDWSTLKETLISNIGYLRAKTILIKGFFNSTLRAGAHMGTRRWNHGAFLIDIDCDLYTSTVQALTFALETGVLRPGSFVYYDDLSEYDRKEHKRLMHLNEENLAHHNISAAWGLHWRTLPSLGNYPGPIGVTRAPPTPPAGAPVIPGTLAWVEQFPASHKGRWIPPERYPAVLQLLSCERCPPQPQSRFEQARPSHGRPIRRRHTGGSREVV
jgi:hypothetical protein